MDTDLTEQPDTYYRYARKFWWLMFLYAIIPVVAVLGIGFLKTPFSGFVEFTPEILTFFRLSLSFSILADVICVVWVRKWIRSKGISLRALRPTAILTYSFCGVSVILAALSYLINGLWLDFLLILGISILQFIVYYPRYPI